MQKRVHVETVDSYFATQPENTKAALEKVRQTIKETAPDAEEVISYAMPAFRRHKVFVFYAGFTNHYSLFFMPDVMMAFAEELTEYKTSKSAINIPFDKPFPAALIKKIVKFAVKYDAEQAQLKTKKKK